MASHAGGAVAVTRGPAHHFFGYYDKCPWDATGRYLLALEVPFMDRPPAADDAAVIGVIDSANGCSWRPLAETRAWNWQQGAMLQWLRRQEGSEFRVQGPEKPTGGNRREGEAGPTARTVTPEPSASLILYNDQVAGRFVAVIRDAATNAMVRMLPRPVAAVSPDGRQAVSLNFARIHRHRPGYGYVGVADTGADDPAPADDGVWRLDLETGRDRLIISIGDLARRRPKDTMLDTSHWFNHCLFNPTGTRFCFLHRWRVGRSWATRLYTANPDGMDLRLLADHDLVSHFDWRDARHLLAWARQPQPGGFTDEDSRDYADGFFLFDDATGEATPVGAGVLIQDGHSSYSPDRRWILTDTYPNREHKRTLLLYNVAENRRVDLGRFFSPPELARIGVGGECRSDLHPRWNRNGTAVCFDSAHEGTRQMYVLDVAEEVRRPAHRRRKPQR